ncbi:hypothetical protein DVH24_039088 [Malus domestica]|uniref:Reverse transcriptase zinc-binding domain-containing protein n=1 Tax=Malus domestica TaxID=3750 RepID=A0A498KEJ3_MALDO|nr:hypothetical protein DVH24_039088 [Malus domestica]
MDRNYGNLEDGRLLWIYELGSNSLKARITKSAIFYWNFLLGVSKYNSSTITAEVQFLWKVIWQACIPGKVKICVWRECTRTAALWFANPLGVGIRVDRRGESKLFIKRKLRSFPDFNLEHLEGTKSLYMERCVLSPTGYGP